MVSLSVKTCILQTKFKLNSCLGGTCVVHVKFTWGSNNASSSVNIVHMFAALSVVTPSNLLQIWKSLNTLWSDKAKAWPVCRPFKTSKSSTICSSSQLVEIQVPIIPWKLCLLILLHPSTITEIFPGTFFKRKNQNNVAKFLLIPLNETNLKFWNKPLTLRVKHFLNPAFNCICLYNVRCIGSTM